MRPDLEVIRLFSSGIIDFFGRSVNRVDEEIKKLKKKCIEKAIESSANLTKMLKMANKLTEKQAEALEESGYLVMTGLFELKSQGLVGLGGGPFKPIFEVGLNVDPVLGLPYYPGSGIKGAVRAYMEGELRRDLEIIFGESSEMMSLVTFLDAYPVGCAGECSVFEGVITNPHYFSSGEPVDTELEVVPVPIAYVGIGKGLVFRITIGVNKELANSMIDEIRNVLFSVDSPQTLLMEVGKYTVKALRTGVAAKASKGYNVFELFTGPLSFRIKKIKYFTSNRR